MDMPHHLVGKRGMPPIDRANHYLYSVNKLLPQPGMMRSIDRMGDRDKILAWIGNNIDKIDRLLASYLQDCHECFFPERRRQIQILAVPLDSTYGLMGWCNIQTQPISILVDIGRVIPADWPALIAHEYVHAHLAKPGHDLDFAKTLTHLCLGLGLDLPLNPTEDNLRYHPPCRIVTDPLAFWRGELDLILQSGVKVV
jgi:hypothetical protein